MCFCLVINRNFGFVFTKRTPRSITITFNGQEEVSPVSYFTDVFLASLSSFEIFQVYELLCILAFNNVRKRMSVILKRDGKIRLYCKARRHTFPFGGI